MLTNRPSGIDTSNQNIQIPPPSAIDANMLAELQDLLAEDFSPMMHNFLADLQQGIDDLRSAKAANNNTVGHDIAHRLKGASLNLGANTLAEQCHAIQVLCQSVPYW
ncbi:Hpt domain-containing protein [Faucicola atlantae]|uniref:Hpt domain-containing protein n=1 Tax=Faucicola atlantae TaxID=34059 RepID=UPI0025B2410D|nr:Hpt domain-containing protein [Moraxella atlantae]